MSGSDKLSHCLKWVRRRRAAPDFNALLVPSSPESTHSEEKEEVAAILVARTVASGCLRRSLPAPQHLLWSAAFQMVPWSLRAKALVEDCQENLPWLSHNRLASELDIYLNRWLKINKLKRLQGASRAVQREGMFCLFFSGMPQVLLLSLLPPFVFLSTATAHFHLLLAESRALGEENGWHLVALPLPLCYLRLLPYQCEWLDREWGEAIWIILWIKGGKI